MLKILFERWSQKLQKCSWTPKGSSLLNKNPLFHSCTWLHTHWTLPHFQNQDALPSGAFSFWCLFFHYFTKFAEKNPVKFVIKHFYLVKYNEFISTKFATKNTGIFRLRGTHDPKWNVFLNLFLPESLPHSSQFSSNIVEAAPPSWIETWYHFRPLLSLA